MQPLSKFRTFYTVYYFLSVLGIIPNKKITKETIQPHHTPGDIFYSCVLRTFSPIRMVKEYKVLFWHLY